MTRVALVALGGAIGSVARYGVQALAAQLLGPAFPWGTLLVNLTGSFLIALVMHVALTGTAVSLELRIFLTTGIMGGFTTYSSFNYETLAPQRHSDGPGVCRRRRAGPGRRARARRRIGGATSWVTACSRAIRPS